MIKKYVRQTSTHITNIKYSMLRMTRQAFSGRKLFCPVPFWRMEIKRGGTTNLCGWLTKSPGNLYQADLKSLWNSSSAQEIRASILDGTFRYCNLGVCPYYRSGTLPLQKDVAGNPYERIIRDGCTRMERMKLWLSFDHRCNIQCFSCRKDDVILPEKEKKENRWMMDAVIRDLPSVDTIGLCGKGEPFVSPVVRDFLFDVDSEKNPHLKIFILTNGQLLHRENWESMRKAHPAISSVQVSIDAATQDTYERIRSGAKFDVLMKNLEYLSGLRSRNLIHQLIISFVVNDLNFMEMKQFAQTGFRLKCDYVYFAFMSNWGIFKEQEYKEMAIHLPGHKNHSKLKEVLADPVFDDSRIFIRTSAFLRGRDVMNESIFI